MLSKANFSDNTSGLSAELFHGPQTVFADGDRLLIVDNSDNRILVYNTIPNTSGAAADYAIGQPDLSSDDHACTAAGLNSPESAIIIDGKLVVADGSNNRVLIWNSVPTTFSVSADIVLGQSSFASCDINGGGAGTPSASSLSWPSDVWSDGTRLLVADTGNNRLLLWNSFPTANNTAADIVIGQPDFTSDGWGDGATEFNYPYMIDSNGTQIFVADSSNNRVVVFNEFPEVNGAAADIVLGQTAFGQHDRDADFGGPNSVGFFSPDGVYVYENQLFVLETGNNRVLVFEGL